MIESKLGPILPSCVLIENGTRLGTGFVLQVRERRVLVTARHLFTPRPARWAFQASSVGGIQEIQAPPIDGMPTGVDIDIFDWPSASQVATPIPASVRPMYATYGQEAYFFGFPHGIRNMTRDGLPGALVKRGIVSAFVHSPDMGGLWLIDAFSNEGFSGGPVLVRDLRGGTEDLVLCGVVRGHRHDRGKVVYVPDSKAWEDRQPVIPEQFVALNSGLMVASEIGPVIEMLCVHSPE